MSNQAMSNQPVRLAMIGCGGMARHHIRRILQQQDTTEIVRVCEPSGDAYEATCEVFEEVGLTPPPNEPELSKLLAQHGDEIDAVFIITPHAFHHDQAKACLEAGVDVLLEKPMVINAAEAESLIEARDRTGRLLVVSFNGSLSPQIRTAVRMLRSGDLGTVLNIHAVAWQSWRTGTANTWRQVPEIAGGGFFFDTGAHMLNTVSDLAGEDFVEVAAWLDNRGAPVDMTGSVMAKLRSGTLVTMSACGETIRSCHSDLRVFCTDGILRTGIWGERLEVQYDGEEGLNPVEVPESLGQWQQFLRVRNGLMENPCPPEIGLRMARLWDAMQESSAKGGQLVQCG
ncbi:MAG: Gfo/Idh/MocA family oxidoreductase [Chloroflexota bacterium]